MPLYWFPVSVDRNPAWGNYHGLLQSRLCMVHMAETYIPASLLQDQGTITCLKLCPNPDICKHVSCDDTGGHPILLDRQSWVGNIRPHLFDWQAGDTPSQDFGRGSLEKGREEGVLQGLFNQAERLPNVWGDTLDEIPLLL